ncbi:carboxylesterase/lipase family protein [Sphingomonas carotinifaciens]|uniref:Carboxylic ester hydrolase n=1 Tax=Sphingomonas carotinifaciens TaxID=1166323 RepID=A0A1G7RQ20_9SPHN|nr:carboxylesterase family protein [Sphingomonas carotinifaciens]MBB4088102.1 para-nitrobenzyl esterase [Sphingomonas carotinifaciens]MWC44826.1 carboxylesterase family protein [Sphingomonas carotinifaciens]SDG12891.1 para-nitrobenzyl esterase [Sphingomonas carotinifaciens]
MTDTSQIVVRTASGTVRGRCRDGILHFANLPYAAAPVGPRRFAAPAPVDAWDGVRDLPLTGPTAPQRLRAVPGLDIEPLVGTGWTAGDDYLTLDIWTPAGGERPWPVMVFVHGGGFVIGSKDAAVQDGATFARDGIVCVSINYRLGVDGFLPIPGVPTNLGLRDIIAALGWVRDEIAAFGGDPANVTVFGESAGAMAIADLVTSPLASGLFRRAIIQSGHGAMTRETAVARRLVDKLAKLLGIAPTRDGFASVDAQAMLDAVEKVSLPTARIDLRGSDGREPVFGISRFVPVHGDDLLPLPPLDALGAGAGKEVDVLIGTNAEEMNLYLVPSGVRDRIGRLLAWIVLRKSQPRAWSVLKAYGAGRKRGGRALTDAMSDLVFRWPARRFAEEHRGRTHVYELEWRSPAFAGELGAAHAVENPFVFDTLAAASGPQGLLGENPPQELAIRMHRLWIDFATDGSLPWAPFDRETRQVYRMAAGEAAYEAPMPAAAFLP